MPVINIEIKNKIALNPANAEYICGNADFLIGFAFDAEWDAYVTKTARFVWNDGYQDVVFQGNQCEVPVISNTATILCGVFAGDLHTTTPALIRAQKSILCGNPHPAPPAPDVYAQMVALFNAGLDESRVNADRAEGAKTAAEEAQRKAAAAQSASEQIAKEVSQAKTDAQAAQKAAEDAKAKAETAQTAAEKAKTESETAQRNAETAQAGAEAARQGAAEALVVVNQFKQDAQTAQGAAAQSAIDANASKVAAAKSEQNAKNSEEKAAGYTSHPPIHGDNGNWLLWNGKAYEDSGKPYTFTEQDKQDVMDEVISHFINVSEVGL